MNGLTLLVWLTVAASPVIEVVTLTERQLLGTLESFTAESVIVKTDTESVTIPIGEVLTIRSKGTAPLQSSDARTTVQLVDGSSLGVQNFVSKGNVITVTHPKLGELSIPVSTVSSVRFAPPDSRVDQEWNQLLERATKKDMIAIRKGDLLDHLDGVIGSLSESTLQFQLEGDDIPVKREKIF